MNVQGQPLQQPGGQAQAQQQQAQQQQQGPPAPVIFARTPARFQQNHLLNYREKSDIEIYNKGAAPLTSAQETSSPTTGRSLTKTYYWHQWHFKPSAIEGHKTAICCSTAYQPEGYHR
mmetsp:Transcript_22752/g.32604  ORF Transcript_22752/g.32604 Transcript_22752/m.32604 type:complete len:118 (-) Transcript_22752:394-747(-)